MVRLSPSYKTHPARLQSSPRKGAAEKHPHRAEQNRATGARLSASSRQASYWLSDANEMAAINTILIIVNRFAP
jgi:hypothetical protein